MTYKNKLLPWCIFRCFPNQGLQLIIRFRRRSDAQAHLQILKSNNPTASYEIIFDVTPDKSDSDAPQEALSGSSYRDYRD